MQLSSSRLVSDGTRAANDAIAIDHACIEGK